MHSSAHPTVQSSASYSPIHQNHPAAADIKDNFSSEPKKSVSTHDDHHVRNEHATATSSFRDQMKTAEENQEFSSDSWMSLLGLLNPIEFFVTVDSFPIWRRHVAWAKPDGNELRQYTTQRFSSNMVLLSLLLGTEMTFLLDSETRQALKHSSYDSFVFWLAITIMISACITVIGLVATFTAWGMVSAISDANTHCLLRSNIGQYVTSLPAHFVVASLYIFLLWLIMWIINLLNGGFICMVLILWVCYVFFQVVISLSAFGRLIIHTGAMGTANVLDPRIEQRLLPSGLHASLLIKAMHRKRKCASAVSQYRTPHTSVVKDDQGQGDSQMQKTSSSNNLNYGSLDPSNTAVLEEQNPPSVSFDAVISTDEDDTKRSSVQDSFPRPSILNSTSSRNLFAVVETVLSQCALSDMEPTHGANPNPNIADLANATAREHCRTGSALNSIEEQEEREWEEAQASIVDDLEHQISSSKGGDTTRRSTDSSTDLATRTAEIHIPPSLISRLLPPSTISDKEEIRPPVDLSAPLLSTPRRRPTLRQSLADFLRGQIKRSSWLDVEQEWIEENDARELYHGPSPDQVGLAYDDGDDEDVDEDHVNRKFSPRAPVRIKTPVAASRQTPLVRSLPPSAERTLASSSLSRRGDAKTSSANEFGTSGVGGETEYLLPKHDASMKGDPT